MSDQSYGQLQLTEEEKNKLKEIVLARLQVMPDNVSVAMGNDNYSKQDLVKHVESEDEIGTQIMAMDLEFLQDLASGAILGDE